MRRLAGQAARHCGRLAHELVQLAYATVIAVLVVLAVLTWRLSRGPLELPWLVARLELAANTDAPTRLALGSAALAWEGFRGGVDRPVDIRVTDVLISDPAGNRIAAVPRAEVSLSFLHLLLGRLVPRAIEVDGARLRVLRGADGSVTLDLGGLSDAMADSAPGPGSFSSAALLQQFSRPAVGDRARGRPSRWAQLQRVRIRDATISVNDRPLGLAWALRGLAVDLRREAHGGVQGQADAMLGVAGQSAHLVVTAKLDSRTHETRLTAGLGQMVPAGLAAAIPAAAALAPLAMPVALDGSLRLDAALQPEDFSARAELAAGTLKLGPQITFVAGGELDAEGTPQKATLRLPWLQVSPRPEGPPTTLQAHADLARTAGGSIDVGATLDLDRVEFADLPLLWPPGVGGPGSRPWIVENITDGVAHDGHVELSLRAPADFSDIKVVSILGGIDGDGVTVHWLRPVPPIEDGVARLAFAGTDALEVTVKGGRQGGLRIKGGRVMFTGLNEPDQFADIQGDVAGPVPDLLAVLRHPRVKLLDRSPLPVSDAAGDIDGRVMVTHLPLKNEISMDDVNIRTTAKLTNLKLNGIAAGRDLTNGTFALGAGPDGLRASGTGTLAGLPNTSLTLDMDFRAGPRDQVRDRIVVASHANERQLAALGLDAGGVLTGSVGLSAAVAVHRDGQAEAQFGADLAQARLAVAELNFAKPAGAPAALQATVALDNGGVTAVAPLRLTGDGVDMLATVDFAGGKPSIVRLQRLRLGPGTDMHGSLGIPQAHGDPWRVDLAGASLDATAQFARTPHAPTPAPEPPPGPPYVADLRFDRVVLGPGRAIADVVAHAENDGRVMRQASVTGRTLHSGGGATNGGAPFRLAIVPSGGMRQLTGSTNDAGALLLALDLDEKFQGGRLTLTGSYDDTRPEHPLAGTVVVEDFRIRNAPMLAHLLQAMTLYGLVEIVQGPGLGFSRLEAPYVLGNDVLTLNNARAFSASLGMTAQGRLDLARHVADLRGTIVPAYFFNSLLGDIPLIGRLFSPERGGGVFAATYTLHGPLDNPTVSVNPLAALTPGFLRGVFGLLDKSQPAPTTAPSRGGQAR